MDLGIAGKRALVCGASQGMGAAIATELAAEGAKVFICSRSALKLKELADQIAKKTGKTVEYVSCDLGDAAARDGLIKFIMDKEGGLDIIVHNTAGPNPSMAEDTPEADYAKAFDSLFQSLIHLNRTFTPGMKERRWGRIINITSLSVVEPIGNLVVSNAVRSAATAMLKTLSDELAPFNITVNCVAPGSISTGRVEELVEARAKKANVSQEAYMKDYIKAIPMARMGTPEEFAHVVSFLASEPSSYVTGSTICVDGGKRRSTY